MYGILGLTNYFMVEGCFCSVTRLCPMKWEKLSRGEGRHKLSVRAIQNMMSPGASWFLAQIQSLFSFRMPQTIPQISFLEKYSYREHIRK